MRFNDVAAFYKSYRRAYKMNNRNENDGSVGRRVAAMGLGAMLLGGTQLAGCAGATTGGPAPNAKNSAAPEKGAMPYARPAPFTAEQFWMAMLTMFNESFTTEITRERVEQALGQKFARFSDPTQAHSYLDMGMSWYFNAEFSKSYGRFSMWDSENTPGMFSNGPLLFYPFVERSLSASSWQSFAVSIHALPRIGYQRNNKELYFWLEGNRVSSFSISLNQVDLHTK